jgi:hypothetical protein
VSLTYLLQAGVANATTQLVGMFASPMQRSATFNTSFSAAASAYERVIGLPMPPDAMYVTNAGPSGLPAYFNATQVCGDPFAMRNAMRRNRWQGSVARADDFRAYTCRTRCRSSGPT